MQYNTHFFVLCVFSCVIICQSFPVGDEEEIEFYLKKFGYLAYNIVDSIIAVLGPDVIVNALKNFERFARINQTGCIDKEPSDPPPDISDAPDLCQDASMNTVTRTQNGNTYVFKGDFYWKVLDTEMAEGYPRKISDDWDGLEGNLDASLTWSNGKTYFFKGEMCWRFTNEKMDAGYPKLLSSEFEGIPDTIDAAFEWSGDGKTYFFKGNQYWMYDRDSDPPVRVFYPMPISDWRGLPNNIDAAFQWENHKTYFFKDDAYYRFDDISLEVESQKPPYPRSTSVWWFGCQYISHKSNKTVCSTETSFNSEDSIDKEPSSPPPDISDAPDLCQDASMDTVTRTQNGNTYVFKGDFYWKVLDGEIAEGYPRRISDDWDGLEGNLDASLTWPNGKTYIFKGERCWRFTNEKMDAGYPKLLSTEFEGIPDSIDAAFVWGGNGKTYFFKGNQYWMYDRNKDPPVYSSYPNSIIRWTRLPNSIDAAFQWENQQTYLFKDDKYYKLDDISFKVVESEKPPYPRSTSVWWFGCQYISHKSNETISSAEV